MNSTRKPKVLLDPHFRSMDEIFSPDQKANLYDLVEVIWGKDSLMPQDDFLAALPEAEILICTGWRYGDVLEQAKNLQAIIEVAGAFPLGLDYEYCYQHKIRVLSVAPAFARQVAEMSLAFALDLARDVTLGDRAMRQGAEAYLHEGNRGTFMLYNQPVGIIGYGNIGQELHSLIKPFQVEVMVYDPWISAGYLRHRGVEPVNLDELLGRSRVIFVLAAPSKENQEMLSRDKLELIKSNAALILVSRAHVVDFQALTEMVVAGRFKLATDVFPTEPLDPGHPLRKAENAVLSAHRAGAVQEGLWEIGDLVIQDLEAIGKGLPPRRLQTAEPELSHRYTVNRAKAPKEV